MKVLMADSLVGNDYSFCLCSGLNSAGIDVDLVVTEDRQVNTEAAFSLKFWAPSKGQATGKVKKTGLYIKYLMDLLRYIRKNDIKVVHFQFFRRERIEVLFYVLLRMLGVKVVFTAHDIFPHNRRKIDYPLRSLVYRASQGIIAHSEHIKKKLKEEFDVNDEKIFVIPHGDFDYYLPETPVPQSMARKTLGLKKEDQVVLFFGFIKEYKGLDLLLDAFETAAAENPRLKLVIAGMPESEQLQSQYEARIQQMDAGNRVIAHFKFVENEMIPVYFSASDAVALPYKNIYHSGIVHLAYSFAKPLIATKVGDFEECIEEGKSGFLLNQNTAEQFADKLMEAFSNPAKLSEMGEYARHLNETKYSWKNAALLTKMMYEALDPPNKIYSNIA